MKVMDNIGKIIKDSYCNGYAGRRYDLAESVIEAEGKDWIVCRTDKEEVIFMDFDEQNKQTYIDNWTDLTFKSE